MLQVVEDLGVGLCSISSTDLATNYSTYYEEMLRFDPTFYVPTEEEWRESPAGKEEARRASQTAMYAVLTIFFLLTIFAASD